MDNQPEDVQFPPGHVRQKTPAGTPPGQADEAGGQNDADAGPGSAASLNQAESGRHSHGDDGGNPAQKEAGNAEEDRPGVKNDSGRKRPGDQHHGDADGADDEPLCDPPEQRLFSLTAAGNQIEKKGDGQKDRHVIDEIQEMSGYHCFSTSFSVFSGTATAAFFTTTRLRPPAFAS